MEGVPTPLILASPQTGGGTGTAREKCAMYDRHAVYDVHPVKLRARTSAGRADFEVLRDVQALLTDSHRFPEGAEVSAIVREGVVTLHGTTRWPRDRAAVRRAVGRIPGVTAVGCDLTAREPEPTWV